MTDEQHTPEEMDTIFTNLTKLAESKRESCCSSPSAGSVWIAYTPQTNNLCSIACSPMLFREREQALEFVEKLTNQNEKWLIEQVTVSTPNAGSHRQEEA